jgi:hypothetical protein
MKRKLLFIAMMFFAMTSFSQKNVYWTTGGELIYSWGQLEYTDDYKAGASAPSISDMPVRFTCFFHIGQNIHLDLSNKLGLYSGFGIRNIGMISDENLPTPGTPDANFQAKVIRRTYSLGIPLAIKLGSFDDNFFLFGGGEIEWAFHMKEKWWDEHDRDGNKTKNTEWFAGDRINPWLPSVFAGIQFPGGINVKFKYYLTDFLNHNYSTNKSTNSEVVSDLTKYKSSQLMYVSLSYNIGNDKIKNSVTPSKVAMVY